jgi:hypothetical protein
MSWRRHSKVVWRRFGARLIVRSSGCSFAGRRPRSSASNIPSGSIASAFARIETHR